MSSVDAAWLGMDSPDNLMMVTGVMRLDERLDRDRLLRVLEDRLLARYPKFTMRAVPSRAPFEAPVWAVDPDFDLGRHVVTADPIHSDAEITGLVSRLLGAPLDMRHAPWQFHLVDVTAGPDGVRPRTAVVARLHHCLADGMALASVLLSLTDEHPDREPSSSVAAQAARLPLGPRFAGQVVRTGLGLLFAARDPRTRLRGRLGREKGAAWTEGLDLALIKRVATALDATVNDVLLAVVAGAIRRHLLGHGDRAHDVRIFVPVDLRPPDEPVPSTLGNRFGIVFITLPVAEPDPVARVRATHERMAAVKAGAQASATFAILAIVGALPVWGHRLAVRILGAKSTAVVTNVPGPREPVFLAGARVTSLVFWVPQAGTIGLGVSVLSYAGQVTIGVAADRNLVPDPAQLVAGVEAELRELVRRTIPVDGPVELRAVEIDSRLARSLVDEVQQEYVRRYGGPDRTPVDPGEFAAPDGAFLVATRNGTAIGCAGMRRHQDGVVEVKRMFVRVEHRRRGHGRRMLRALEDWAREQGYRRVVIETGAAQPEAIALYVGAGYQPVEGFGHYRDSELSRSFARDL